MLILHVPGELQRLREEVQALRLANAALEERILVGAEEMDAALHEVLAQRNALRKAHRQQSDLAAFVQRVMDTVASLVIVLDVDGRIRLVNSHCRESLGQAGPDPTGARLDEFLHPDERSALAAKLPPLPWTPHSPLYETIRQRGRYQAEHRLAARDGGFRHYLVDAATLHNYQGKEEGVVVSATDITARKATEDALQKLSHAVEQSQESIVITDLRGDIEYVNAAFSLQTGYSREEAIGQNLRILKSGKTPEETYAQLWDALARGQNWKGEFINRRKDGSEYIDEAIISPFHLGDGRIAHYIAVQEDVTGKKQMLAELQQHRHHLEERVAERTQALVQARQQAEALASAKSEFLANMSHEIRTPLNAVLGFARIGMHDSVGRGVEDTFARILAAGGHLLDVIDDILDYSKIETGKLPIERQPFALAAVLGDARSFVAEAAAEKGLSFEVEPAPDLPVWVLGDAHCLKRILTNLLANAVKFTERGGVCLRVCEAGGRIEFRVTDSGIGLSEEEQGRLFRPFEQADNSTTRRYGGAGLGLAISRKLALAMEGDITVDSQPGLGSVFTLSLPLPAAAAPAPEPVRPATPGEQRLAGVRVLAAEDMDINRLVLADLLAGEGCRIVFAENGQQALDRLDEAGAEAFDVVLMDVQMPVMDGCEATRQIRRKAPGLPVIGLTAHALETERERCLAAGMVEHVTKPIEPELLVAAVLRQVSTRPARASEAPTPAAPREAVAAPESELIDMAALLKRFGGRRAFVDKLLGIALDSQKDTPTRLRDAAVQNDLEAMVFLAHALKGVSGNLMAQRLHEQAKATEAAARTGQPESAAMAQELAGLVEALLAAVANLRAG